MSQIGEELGSISFKYIHKDAEGRLHCEDGKAFELEDGWGMYAWHDIEVPEWVIMEPWLLNEESIQQLVQKRIESSNNFAQYLPSDLAFLVTPETQKKYGEALLDRMNTWKNQQVANV